MTQSFTPRRTGSFQNDRGAAFLLAVYVSALTLLLLGSVSLQRTTTELRTAQLSRDLQQAFWYSEGALDSAVKQSQSTALDTMKTLAIGSLPDRGTVTIVPSHARIFNNNVHGRKNKEHKKEFNPYQMVTKKIIATGTSETNSRRQSIGAYVVETGPLRGVWANGTVAVGAGQGIQPGDIFLSGDLYSAVGAVVSEVTSDKQVMFNGIIGVPEMLAQDSSDTGWQAKLDHWAGVASADMMGIKDGYELLHGLTETRDRIGGSYSNVEFVSGIGSTGAEHVDGALSVGIADTPELFNSRQCNSTVSLTSSTVVVDQNFDCGDPTRANTPGLACSARNQDRSNKKGAIILCAASLAPDSDQAMLDSLAGSPPHVVFRAPTTIVLTGSAPFELKNQLMRLPDGSAIPLTSSVLNIVEQMTGRPMKTNWNVTLGATVSGISALGEAVPVDIVQADARTVRKGRETPHGMVFMKPGDQYRGSIYAPESLIVVRARDCAAAPPGCDGNLSMDYVVGQEVIIELESDSLQIGQSVESELQPGEVTSSFLSWANETPNATEPTATTTAITSGKGTATQ